MADILMDVQSFPVAPSAGQIVDWWDNQSLGRFQRDANGIFAGGFQKSIVAQIAAHSADTYYLGGKLPSFGMQPGSVFEWIFLATKGAAGTAAPAYNFRIGAAGTTADTARLTLNGPAQTAAADSAIIIARLACRTQGGAGVLYGSIHLHHNLAATGFANAGPAGLSLVHAASAGFDNQASAIGGLNLGLSVNPGAAGAWVVEQCVMRALF